MTFGFRIADNHLKAHRCERSEMSNGHPPEKDRLRPLQAMGLVLQLGLSVADVVVLSLADIGGDSRRVSLLGSSSG